MTLGEGGEGGDDDNGGDDGAGPDEGGVGEREGDVSQVNIYLSFSQNRKVSWLINRINSFKNIYYSSFLKSLYKCFIKLKSIIPKVEMIRY